MIDVGGRRVPAAKAPRSHGGLGMGGLSIFEVILGGLGALAGARGRRSSGSRQQSRSSRAGAGLDWGDMLPKRRSPGDVFGPDRQPRDRVHSPRRRARATGPELARVGDCRRAPAAGPAVPRDALDGAELRAHLQHATSGPLRRQQWYGAASTRRLWLEAGRPWVYGAIV